MLGCRTATSFVSVCCVNNNRKLSRKVDNFCQSRIDAKCKGGIVVRTRIILGIQNILSPPTVSTSLTLFYFNQCLHRHYLYIINTMLNNDIFMICRHLSRTRKLEYSMTMEDDLICGCRMRIRGTLTKTPMSWARSPDSLVATRRRKKQPRPPQRLLPKKKLRRKRKVDGLGNNALGPSYENVSDMPGKVSKQMEWLLSMSSTSSTRSFAIVTASLSH